MDSMDKVALHDEMDRLLQEIERDPSARARLGPRLYQVLADLAAAGEKPSPEALRALKRLRATDDEGRFDNLPV